MDHYIGIDLGGTNIVGNVSARKTDQTRHNTADLLDGGIGLIKIASDRCGILFRKLRSSGFSGSGRFFLFEDSGHCGSSPAVPLL